MRKSEILSALEKIPGDPEIEVKNNIIEHRCDQCGAIQRRRPLDIERINEYPRPEIVVVEKQP